MADKVLLKVTDGKIDSRRCEYSNVDSVEEATRKRRFYHVLLMKLLDAGMGC